MKINFKWATDVNPDYIAGNSNEDENWFDTREQAIDWLKEQKKRDADFGDPVTFLLVEMFFI